MGQRQLDQDRIRIDRVSKHFTLRHTRAVKEIVVKGLQGRRKELSNSSRRCATCR